MYKSVKLIVLLLLAIECGVSAQTFTFTCPTTIATWTVPAGVTTIHVDMAGGKGGMNSKGIAGPPYCIDSAGHGARLESNLAVTAGQVLTIYVGQNGQNGTTSGSSLGGSIGGGWAYSAPGAAVTPGICGGGGGGASDIRIGGITFFERVLVAGGGGGAGGNSCALSWPSVVWNYDKGGDGGGTTGEPGWASNAPLGPGAGGGGTSTGGGAGGGSLGPGLGAGGAGTWGTGGYGGLASAGGGGGGGYYGGGGSCYGGGGGGSSYADPAISSSITHTRGYNAGGCGWVIICCPQLGLILGPPNICTSNTATYSNPTATPGGTWSTSNTAIATIGATTGIATGVSAGVVTITYQIAGSCGGGYTTKTVTVNQSPVPIAGTMNICDATTTTLTDATPGGIWSSSNPSVATIGSLSGFVLGSSVGATTISYTTGLGCYDTAIVNIQGLSGPHSVCIGDSITLVASSTGGVWSSGVPAVATVGTTGKVYSVAVGYTPISYAFPIGCTAIWGVTVNPIAPILGSDSVCVNGVGWETNIVGGGVWTSAYPAVATILPDSGKVTGHIAGITNITYIHSTGCMSTKSVMIIDNPPAITGLGQVCVGNTTFLGNAVPGGIWTSANPGIASIDPFSGTVIGAYPGTVDVTYTIKPGCTTVANVLVNPLPDPIIGTDRMCPGVIDTMKDATPMGAWSSSPIVVGSIDVNGAVTAIDQGTLTVKYKLATGCYITKAISVNPIPKPWIAYNFAIGEFVAEPGYAAYQWYDSIQGPIPGATSPTVAALNTEYYFVEVTDSNGCKGRSVLYYFDVKQLGINNVAGAKVKIYPNPVTSMLFIESVAPVRVEISSIEGKKEIDQSNAKTVDMSKLANGIYLISLYDENGVRIAIQKVTKE